jgi:hypothetical protein
VAVLIEEGNGGGISIRIRRRAARPGGRRGTNGQKEGERPWVSFERGGIRRGGGNHQGHTAVSQAEAERRENGGLWGPARCQLEEERGFGWGIWPAAMQCDMSRSYGGGTRRSAPGVAEAEGVRRHSLQCHAGKKQGRWSPGAWAAVGQLSWVWPKE